ncbi:MAG: DUF2271 domain-containing protein [Paludibacter sp.]|nr:DUF2271 domain-containing protein [Paludibacter sp.]
MKKVFIIISCFGFLSLMHAQNYSRNSMEASTPGTLTVTVTTSATATPSFGTKSDDAIWIQNASGTFVKTIVGCTSSDRNDLLTWTAATSSTYNIVDAVTSATRSTYGVRTGTWNGTNVSRVLVADGTYSVKMEMTDFSGQGRLGTFAFTKGPVAQTLAPANILSFSNISIKWVPSITSAVEELKMSNLYQVYPNPTSSSIFVDGLDINQIEVFNVSGKSLMKTSLHNVNLSSLPKGTYMLKINSETGTIMKKIIKN